MIDRLIDRCVFFMINNGAVVDTEDQREIYKYGLELQFYYVLHGAILLGLGLLFGQALEVALLLFLFGMLQSNGGGFHANTHTRCFLIMACAVLVFMALLPIYQSFIAVQAVSILTSLAIILCLAPVAHKNHPLNPEMSKRMGKRAKVIAGIFALTWCLLLLLSILPFLLGVISLVMALSGVSMIAAWVKNYRESKADCTEA